MAYVITDNCIKDELCVQACPVDCIHPRSDEAGFEAATQVYVDPAECIDCGACIPVCTSDAIFPLDEVPAEKRGFIQINEAYYAARQGTQGALQKPGQAFLIRGKPRRALPRARSASSIVTEPDFGNRRGAPRRKTGTIPS